MKKYIVPIILLVAGLSTRSVAQDNKAFAQFARTKDSLMHIAFFDHDVAGYKKHFNELNARYKKLNAKEKKEFAYYIQDEVYYLARIYAVAGDKNKALSNLEQSKVYDYNSLLNEPDFNNLHKESRFIKFVNSVKNQRSSYLLTLQKDAKYNTGEKNNLPAFTYQSANNEHLVALKKRYNLDSIAGKGDDVAQIIYLMQWVHYLVQHNGSKGNPDTKNAASMIRECRRDGKTLNCRGLAIVLNEVYLAMGFKSRFVTCQPKDTADNDCHVITMVWCPSLKKWLWMDPTFMAYVMNEEGEPLSIEEVRSRLVNNKPLIINPDANHNRNETQTKKGYLDYYMAKNLYKLECPLSSEYNYETKEEGKVRAYLQLIPGTTAPGPKVVKDKHGIDAYTVYYTNDPNTFWAPPANAAMGRPKDRSGHTQADYESVMKKFKKYYNAEDDEAIRGLSAMSWPGFWKDGASKRSKEEYGNIIACRYLGMELDNESEDVALFEIVHDKSVHCMGFALNEDNKFDGSFRFHTYSNYIDWLLAKAIDKETKAK